MADLHVLRLGDADVNALRVALAALPDDNRVLVVPDDAVVLDALGLFNNVTNGQLATRGLHSAEPVARGSVGASSLVRDSSIQHIRFL